MHEISIGNWGEIIVDNKKYLTSRSEAYRHTQVMDECWLKWKYLESPNGRVVYTGILKNGEFMGINAYGTELIIINGGIEKNLRPYDTFVLKECRGLGYLNNFLKNIENYASNSEYGSLFFFPNKSSLEILRRSGWMEVKRKIKIYLKIKSINLIRYINDLRCEFTPNFADEISNDKLLDEVSLVPYKINGCMYVTKDYLLWRFAKSKVTKYRLIKLDEFNFAIGRAGKRGRIREFQIIYFSTPEVTSRIINKLLSSIKEYDLITIYFQDGHPQARFKKLLTGTFAVNSKINIFANPLGGNDVNHYHFSGVDFHTY